MLRLVRVRSNSMGRIGIGLLGVVAVGFATFAGACNGDRNPLAPTPPSPPAPRVAIDSPPGGTAGLVVTFRWRLENPEAGQVYSYEVRLDKGVNACDSGIEQAFAAQQQTCLRIDLPATTYSGQRVEFGVRATDSQGRAFCSTGAAALTIDTAAPAAAPCG
jgi:hypothetical protein